MAPAALVRAESARVSGLGLFQKWGFRGWAHQVEQRWEPVYHHIVSHGISQAHRNGLEAAEAGRRGSWCPRESSLTTDPNASVTRRCAPAGATGVEPWRGAAEEGLWRTNEGAGRALKEPWARMRSSSISSLVLACAVAGADARIAVESLGAAARAVSGLASGLGSPAGAGAARPPPWER